MRRLLLASRPFNWINTALPFLAVAISTGRPLSWAVALGTVYFLLPFNLLMYGVNDLYDYESDRRNPRKGGLEGAVLPPAEKWWLWGAVAATNLPLLALLAWLAPLPATAMLLVTAGTAVAYSAPPLRTKVIPGLDSITSALHFTLPAVCGGLAAGALGALPWRFLAALFCWSIASQALGSIQDIGYDRVAGLRSVGTWLGPRTTAALSCVGYSLAVLLTASAGSPGAVLAAATLAVYVLLAASCLGGSELQARRAWRSFLGLNLLCGFLLTQVLLHRWGLGPRDVLLLLSTAAMVLAAVAFGTTLANLIPLRPPAAYQSPVRVVSVPGLPPGTIVDPRLEGLLDRAMLADGAPGVMLLPGTHGGATLARALVGFTDLMEVGLQPHLLRRLTGWPLVAWDVGPRWLVLTRPAVTDQNGSAARTPTSPHRLRVVDGAELVMAPCPAAATVWSDERATFARRCRYLLGLELSCVLGAGFTLLAPFVLLPLAVLVRDEAAMGVSALGTAMVIGLRVLVAIRRREPVTVVLLHPVAVLVTLSAHVLSIADALLGAVRSSEAPAVAPGGTVR
jgi:4-hydroxybenzoate polyprenyltransferase